MRVLIFESDHRGHRLTFVRLMALAMRELADEVIVVLNTSAPGSPEYAAQLAPLAGTVELAATVAPLPESSPKVEAAAKLDAIGQAATRFRPDWLYLPTADGVAQLAGLGRMRGRRHIPKAVEVEALMLQGRVGYPTSGARERLRNAVSLTATALVPWPQFFFLDPMAFEAVQRRGGSLARRSRLMPDPVEPRPTSTRDVARRELGLPTDGRIIGCPGLMDERKGIHLLIPAFADAALSSSDRLLLAGRLAPPIRAMLEGSFCNLVKSERIIVMDRYLTDEELSNSIAAMDVVCTAYPNHRASGSLAIRAAAAERFVLGSDHGWTGAIVPRFGLGRTVNVQDRAAFAQAIATSLEESQSSFLNEAGRRFVRFHTPENFSAVWTARLRAKRGLPPVSTVDWSWVVEG